MRYFILRKGGEYIIFKVKEEDEASFRERYGTEILVEADSLMLLLIRFERDVVYSLDYVQAESQNSSSEKDTGSAGAQPVSDRMMKRG
jgi:hypothetical protein